MALARIVALFVFGVCGLGQDLAADAMQKYRSELEQNPRNSLAHFRLGELFLDQHNYQSAANEFRAALKGEPHSKAIDVWSHLNLGEIFDVTGQRDRAVTEYRQAVGTGDDSGGAQAVAARLLVEGVKGEEVLLLHSFREPLSFVEPAKPLVKVPAGYSAEARIAELEGSVAFVATLAANGSVSDLRLLKPLGLGLDEVARAAAERWSLELAKTENDAVPVSTAINFDFLLPEKQSRWHLVRAVFDTPEGTSPHFVKTNYPLGEGIRPQAFDDAHLVAFLGRQAVVTLSFEVDETGLPVRFQIERPTQRVWGEEAISFVRRWQFSPGSNDGNAVPVRCTVDLVWGEKHFTKESLIRARQEFETASLVP